MQNIAAQFRQAAAARRGNNASPGWYPKDLRELALQHLAAVRRRGGRPSHAARELGIDANTRIYPKRGGHLEEMDGQTEDSEEIDIVERRLVVRKHKKQKYRCMCNACVETAPGPEKWIPGGRYSVGFAVNVAVDKLADHLPWDRQVRRVARDGLIVKATTQWDPCEALAKHLEPLMARLRGYLLTLAVLAADETWWRLMDKKRNCGTKKKWWAWALRGDKSVYFEIRKQRLSDVVVDMLLEPEEVLIVDGHGAYI